LTIETSPPRFQPVTVAEDTPPALHMLSVPNEGMMSGQPTNCFLMGYVAEGPMTLIDCGSAGTLEIFTEAFEALGVDPSRIVRIVLTHCHPDHVGGAPDLKALTGAPVWAHPLEKPPIERFAPDLEVDHWIEDGVPIECEGFSLEPIFTPGHAPGHVALVESTGRMLLAGDMISGFGSVGIFPPDGSVAAYIDSLRRLLAIHDAEPFSLIVPGHGPVIPGVREKIENYIEHRLAREEEIAATLGQAGPSTVDDLLPMIYPDVLPHLTFAAKSTLTMHLRKLIDDSRVTVDDEERYTLV
jgi:glyoxylase-like metal-dependent hydrolase (beta-lactamase superfamily II)